MGNNKYNSNSNFKSYTLKTLTEFVMVLRDIITDKYGFNPPEKIVYINLKALPSDNWFLNHTDLQRRTGLKKVSLKKAMDGLIEKGFLEVYKKHENGRIRYYYRFYELPKSEMKQLLTTENNPQYSDGSIQSAVSNHYSNSNEKHELSNNKIQKNRSNICGTNSSTEDNKNSSKRNSTLEHENLMTVSISQHEQDNAAENSANSDSQNIVSSTESMLLKLNNKIEQAEQRLNDIEKKKKQRKSNEEQILNLLEISDDIPQELKPLLADHVKMLIEKGITTTFQSFKTNYDILLEECPTLKEKMNRIKYATTIGYPSFARKQKNSKTTKKVEFITSAEELENL